jgi:hypothetical protein
LPEFGHLRLLIRGNGNLSFNLSKNILLVIGKYFKWDLDINGVNLPSGRVKPSKLLKECER